MGVLLPSQRVPRGDPAGTGKSAKPRGPVAGTIREGVTSARGNDRDRRSRGARVPDDLVDAHKDGARERPRGRGLLEPARLPVLEARLLVRADALEEVERGREGPDPGILRRLP